MRAVVQRVARSKVEVENQLVGQIDKGLMVLLGVGQDDTTKDIDYMVDKIVNLRIFEDQDDKMNLSLLDVGGQLLVVSQFTLLEIVERVGVQVLVKLPDQIWQMTFTKNLSTRPGPWGRYPYR